MKNLIKVIVLLASSTTLAGCVEDSMYYRDYRDGGYTSSYSSDVTSGYNRDYHHRHRRNTHPTYQPPANSYFSSQPPANNGYSSSGSRPAYSSGHSYAPTNGGYSSSAGSTGGYQSSASQPSQPQPKGKGMFGKALSNKMKPLPQAPTQAPAADTGYSSAPATGGGVPQTAPGGANNGYSSG